MLRNVIYIVEYFHFCFCHPFYLAAWFITLWCAGVGKYHDVISCSRIRLVGFQQTAGDHDLLTNPITSTSTSTDPLQPFADETLPPDVQHHKTMPLSSSPSPTPSVDDDEPVSERLDATTTTPTTSDSAMDVLDAAAAADAADALNDTADPSSIYGDCDSVTSDKNGTATSDADSQKGSKDKAAMAKVRQIFPRFSFWIFVLRVFIRHS